MKVWLVATTDIDYDLYRAAVITAASKEKAEKIAWRLLPNIHGKA